MFIPVYRVRESIKGRKELKEETIRGNTVFPWHVAVF
jgi:hypothetical protein